MFSSKFSRAAGLAAFLALLAPAAGAQSHGQSQYAGASLGSTDYGTGLKLFVGGRVTPVLGWEAQFTSFGSEKFGPGDVWEHSAWALGASGVARFPLGPSAALFGKAGVHYLKPHEGGPGRSDPDGSLELGLGGGLLWHFSPSAAARLEIENIGGSNGDFISVGLQFNF